MRKLRTPDELLAAWDAWEGLRHYTPNELAMADQYFVPEVVLQLRKLNEAKPREEHNV